MALLDNALTVDVGNATAWAHWRGTWTPETECFLAPKGLDLSSYLAAMECQFNLLLTLTKRWKGGLRKVYIEGVELWASSLKSLTAARRGDLFKLSYLVGVYAGACANRQVDFEIIDAADWKGQMKDEAVAERIRRINGEEYANAHIRSAVGMGFSFDKEIWELRNVRQKTLE